MSYEVELPDGTVVEDIPEGTTQAELVRRLRVAGMDVSWHTPTSQEIKTVAKARRAELQAEMAQAFESQDYDRYTELKKEYELLERDAKRGEVGSIGNTVGSTVGGVLGAVGGAALGAPLGPVGVGAGVVGGGAAGSAAGSALGTWIDTKMADEVSEDEAWQLIKDNAIEAAAWDAGLTVLTLGTGKVLKLTGASEALKQALKKAGVATNAKRMAQAIQKQRVAGEPTDVVSEGMVRNEMNQRAEQDVMQRRAKEMSPEDNLAQTAQHIQDAQREASMRKAEAQIVSREGLEKAAEELVTDSGRITTKGQITGDPGWYERILRTVGERQYNSYNKALTNAAEQVRQRVLTEIDDDFVGRTSLGDLFGDVQKRAKVALDETTRPVWEAARQTGAPVDLEGERLSIKKVLDRDASGGSMLRPNERAYFERVNEQMVQNPTWTAEAAQDFISGNKARMRDLTQEGAPSTYMKAALVEVTDAADKSYLEAIKSVGDGKLSKMLMDTRAKYGEFMQDVYSDTMQRIVSKHPERAGAEIFGGGHVSEVKEVRAALEKALETGGIKGNEYKKLWSHIQRGYLERLAPNVESLATLQKRLTENADLRRTFVEMTHADPAFLGRIQTLTSMAKVVERLPQQNGFVQLAFGGLGGTVAGHLAGGPVVGAMVGVSASLLKRASIRASTSPDSGEVIKALYALMGPQLGKAKAGAAVGPKAQEALRKAAETVERWW